ncbi:MAG: glycosyltransferase family 87 protein [Chitinophagales bacterium]
MSPQQNDMLKRITKLIQSPSFILFIYFIAAAAIAWQQFSLGAKSETSTHYNNYVIFKQSFFHLIHSQNLYALYPNEYWDYYKYSPAFALFMMLLAYLPDLLGLIIWNLLNALTLFFAIKSLPVADLKIKVAVWWFVLIELITSLQNSQSNALIAGLLILSFSFLERRQVIWATLMISLTVFIKIFGVVAFSLFFLYPDRKKFVLYSAMWMIILAIVPLVAISPSQLLWQYENWRTLLSMDYGNSVGLSVMGWLHSWFQFDPPKNIITIAGILLFCLPLIFVKRFSQPIFRWLFLSNILIWVVIFNHKAESPTFIIAVSGIALWFFTQKKNYLNLFLLILAFIFTCLSPTDVFPPAIRNEFFVPYAIKVVPCILIWLKIIYELVTKRYQPKNDLTFEV